MSSAEMRTGAAEARSGAQVDYFISRTGADAKWAEWIAWQLESAGYSVIVQDWDFRPGQNFITNMRKALDSARTTIAVCSPAYFRSPYTEDEWTAALVRRRDGDIPLLPVLVARVTVPKLLAPLVYVDLVGVDDATARRRLLAAVDRDKRSKPSEEPRFPGDEPAFPAPEDDGDAAATAAAVAGTRIVNAPPVETPRFTDRTTQQAQLREFLGDRSVKLVSVVGRAGMGKSALASHVLTALREPAERPDEGADPGVPKIDVVLFLNARTTGLSFERLYADVKRVLDDDDAERLAAYWSRRDVTLAQKVEVLVDNLRDRHVLVLLDGLEAALGQDGVVADDGLRAFVEACLTQAGAPRIAATSRVALAVAPELFPGVRAIPLVDGLATPDAMSLLKDLDPQGQLGLAEAEEADLLRAVELTGGIPRALELLAGILQADPAASLPRLLDDEQLIGSQVVEKLVAEGYRRLDPDEQRVMEAMAAFDRPAPEAAVAFVVHRWFPDIDVRASLRRLTSSYFASANRATGDYLIQSADRVHAYRRIPVTDDAPVAEIARPTATDAPPYTRSTVESRVADWYASIRKPPEAWRAIEDVAPQLAEFRHRVLAGELDAALEVLDLIDRDHLFLWGHYTRLIELRQTVLDAPASPRPQAANLASLGLASQVLGQYDDALRYYEGAVNTAAAAGDKVGHARYVGDLGRLYRNLGYMDEAIAASQEALTAAIAASDRQAEGRWKDRLGLAYAFVGRLEEGLALLDEALAIAREFGDRRSEGAALSNRGLILQVQGRIVEAEQAFRASLEITRAISDRRGDAIILGRLGFIAEGRGDHAGALALHEEALAISLELGERREQSYQLLGIGKARVGMGQLEDGAEKLRLSRDLDMPETSYLAAMALSLVLMRLGSAESAASVADTIRRCDERLARSGLLFGARYTRATALVASARLDPRWADDAARHALLVPAIEEYDRALAICAGAGIVAATVRDLDLVEPAEAPAMASVRGRLDAVLAASPPVEPVTPAMVANEAPT